MQWKSFSNASIKKSSKYFLTHHKRLLYLLLRDRETGSNLTYSQAAFTCSKLTIKTLEQGVQVSEFFLLCLLQKSNKLNLVSKYLLSVNSNTTRSINWICSSDTRITPRWFSICFIEDRSFSAQAKFSENLTFLTPWHADVRVRIRGEEMLIFRKSFRTY